ncbi:MAG: vanadium-dependent haloperoxidase [Saprospiraceae bacterium]
MKNAFLILFCIVVSFTTCKKDEMIDDSPTQYDASLVYDWFRLECTIVKETGGFFPPQAARAFGYTSIALYESIVPGIPQAASLAGQLQDFNPNSIPKIEIGKEYHWSIVANAALATIMRQLFEKKISPENLTRIADLENKNYIQLSTKFGSELGFRSANFGKSMANAVFQFSKTDGGHEQYVDPFQLPYTWPAKTGSWIPTGAALNPLAPTWQNCRPFLNSDITQSQPLAHVDYSIENSSEFYKEAMNVYNIVTNATAEQKEIARFWADDPFNTCTPTGHTFNILTQLLEENNADLVKAAVGYAKLGIAENDAFIACWKTKYDYFLLRPVTYIKQNIDPKFATIIGTPPFPAYTSGHATEIAAGARIFTDMFTDGDGNYPFTDRTQIQFGFSVRNFDNFNEMAQECADSRLYGGIHYNMDNLNGLKMGRSIGDNVIKKINWPSL